MWMGVLIFSKFKILNCRIVNVKVAHKSNSDINVVALDFSYNKIYYSRMLVIICYNSAINFVTQFLREIFECMV